MIAPADTNPGKPRRNLAGLPAQFRVSEPEIAVDKSKAPRIAGSGGNERSPDVEH